MPVALCARLTANDKPLSISSSAQNSPLPPSSNPGPSPGRAPAQCCLQVPRLRGDTDALIGKGSHFWGCWVEAEDLTVSEGSRRRLPGKQKPPKYGKQGAWVQEVVLLDMAELRSQTGPLSHPPMSSIDAASTLGQRDRAGGEGGNGGGGAVTRVSQCAQAKLCPQGGVRRGEATGELVPPEPRPGPNEKALPYISPPPPGLHRPSRAGSRSIRCLRDAACGVQPPQDRAGRVEDRGLQWGNCGR